MTLNGRTSGTTCTCSDMMPTSLLTDLRFISVILIVTQKIPFQYIYIYIYNFIYFNIFGMNIWNYSMITSPSLVIKSDN